MSIKIPAHLVPIGHELFDAESVDGRIIHDVMKAGAGSYYACVDLACGKSRLEKIDPPTYLIIKG